MAMLRDRKMTLATGLVALLLAMTVGALTGNAREVVKRDVLKTSAGDVELMFIGHASLMLTFRGQIIHFDPYGKVAEYSRLPKADLVFITHDHNDHFDLKALEAIRKDTTIVVLPPICADKVPDGWIVENGETLTILNIDVQVGAAYNIVNKRENGQPYHRKGIGNGYVLTLGDKRIYVAGDTENIPEMRTLKAIDVAFLPMNMPATMTPEMVAEAARVIKPKILYPYHYGDTDPTRLVKLLQDTPSIQVRIRPLR